VATSSQCWQMNSMIAQWSKSHTQKQLTVKLSQMTQKTLKFPSVSHWCESGGGLVLRYRDAHAGSSLGACRECILINHPLFLG
jgi:hypothetical protein